MYQIYQAARTKQVLARVHNIFGFCYRAQKCEKGSIQADWAASLDNDPVLPGTAFYNYVQTKNKCLFYVCCTFLLFYYYYYFWRGRVGFTRQKKKKVFLKLLEIGSRHQKSRSQKTSACLCGSIVASCGIQESTISSYTATHGSVRILAWLQSLHGMWQMEQIFSFLKVTAPWPCHSCTRVLSLWTKIFLLALTHTPLINSCYAMEVHDSMCPQTRLKCPGHSKEKI